MSEKIVQLNEEVIKGQIKELVRGSVEETLNGLLEEESKKLTQAAKYERNEVRQGYRSGQYSRNLTTTSGDVTLQVPRLKGISFETAIIERYRRRESGCRCSPGRGYHGSSLGKQGIPGHHQRAEQESIRSYRRLAQPSITGWKVSVCLRRWDLSSPELGR